MGKILTNLEPVYPFFFLNTFSMFFRKRKKKLNAQIQLVLNQITQVGLPKRK